jgi:hypothetical protein
MTHCKSRKADLFCEKRMMCEFAFAVARNAVDVRYLLALIGIAYARSKPRCSNDECVRCLSFDRVTPSG